ncbi:MAG: shikimate dehydrogenase (NADP+) [Planctomycetota bacterium]|nr:MAG: shikimate dehydrogenase (NADP+) [Planctomycetota bacterium]
MLRLGIVGYPLTHSLSPELHAAFAEVLGLSLRYERYPVAAAGSLAGRLAELAAAGLRGVNVTVPHKVRAAALARACTEEVRACGAANTLRFGGGALELAHNTDLEGFARALAEAGIAPARRSALVLGAGGAARAVALALRRAGGAVWVAARRIEQARALVRALEALDSNGVEDGGAAPALRVCPWPERHAALAAVELVVNATPLGMAPQAAAAPLEEQAGLSPRHAVVDLVYNPRVTLLLRRARAAGARAIDGTGMLVHQGIGALELWLGRRFTEAERERLVTAGRAVLARALGAGAWRLGDGSLRAW